MKRIGIISCHASPTTTERGDDSSGESIYVRHIARELAGMGYDVEVLTRRNDATTPEIVPLDGARVVNVPAGPATCLPPEGLSPYLKEFADCVVSYSRRHGTHDLVHADLSFSGLAASTV